MRIRRNILPKSIQDAGVTTFVLIIIPVVYYFELFIVIPKYHELWDYAYLFHFVAGTFLMWNICANYVAIVLCDTSIDGKFLRATLKYDWKFCSVCECVAPPRSWHCVTCNVCILKRDHHCKFTGCCVGHFNQRYFLVFVLYMFIATVYSTFYNVCFIKDFVEFESWTSIFKIIFPLAAVFVSYSRSQIYLFLVLIIFVGCLFTGALLYFHYNLLKKGVVTPERKQNLTEYDAGMKQNLINVLGHKWYLAWLSPFVVSDLPQDGIHWHSDELNKTK